MVGIQWLASYPKSGNTWLRLMLASAEAGGTPLKFPQPETRHAIASARHWFEESLHIESGDLTHDEIELLRPVTYRLQAAEMEQPALRKVHDAWTLNTQGVPLFPPDATDGVVYIVRDPRDVAPSLASHNGITVERAIAVMADPDHALAAATRRLANQLRQRVLTWSGHVESWLDASGARLMVVRYEDMKADPGAVLAEVGRFIGRPFGAEVISGAVAATRFDVLRETEAELGFRERPRDAQAFFRRGIAGGWRDELSAEQAARIEADHGPVMRRLGYL